MAKPFGKTPYEWLRLPSTISFIEVLKQYGKIPKADNQAVNTIKGGLGSGITQNGICRFALWSILITPVLGYLKQGRFHDSKNTDFVDSQSNCDF